APWASVGLARLRGQDGAVLEGVEVSGPTGQWVWLPAPREAVAARAYHFHACTSSVDLIDGIRARATGEEELSGPRRDGLPRHQQLVTCWALTHGDEDQAAPADVTANDTRVELNSPQDAAQQHRRQ